MPKTTADSRSKIESEDAEKPWRSPEILHHLYWDQKKSTTEVGEILGCHQTTVCKWLHRTGVGTRDQIEATRKTQPLYTHDSDGYEWVVSRCGEQTRVVRVHQLVTIVHGEDSHVVFDDNTVVHHRNGLPWDNRPSNLQVMTTEEHARLHAKERQGGQEE
jgi:hypothetical protein